MGAVCGGLARGRRVQEEQKLQLLICLSLGLTGEFYTLPSALCPAACIPDMCLQLALIMYSKAE